MTPSNANTSGLDCARIVACHLPEAHCLDTVCLPITITAGDLRAVYSVLVTVASDQARIAAAEARADRLAKALDDIASGYANCDDFQDAQDIVRATLQQEG